MYSNHSKSFEYGWLTVKWITKAEESSWWELGERLNIGVWAEHNIYIRQISLSLSSPSVQQSTAVYLMWELLMTSTYYSIMIHPPFCLPPPPKKNKKAYFSGPSLRLHKKRTGDAGDRTRGLSHAKRTLYHWATSPSCFNCKHIGF